MTVERDSTPPSAPLIGGIAPKSYLTTALPAAASIGCVASDPTSGVAGCTVAGYSAIAGAHTLTATATNGAGLVATATLAYTVAKPAAIAQLTLAKGVTLAKLATSGLPVTLRVATASTKLVVKLVARVPKATGKGTRMIVLGTLERVSRQAPRGSGSRSRRRPSGSCRARSREGDIEGHGHGHVGRRSDEAAVQLAQRSPLDLQNLPFGGLVEREKPWHIGARSR